MEHFWRKDGAVIAPKQKVRPVFCISHSRVAPLPRETLMGGKAGPSSPSQTLTGVDEERTQEGMRYMAVWPHITNPNWLLPPLALTPGSPSLALFCEAVGWVPLPTMSHRDGGKWPQKETKEKGWCARVAQSWAPWPVARAHTTGPLAAISRHFLKGPLYSVN